MFIAFARTLQIVIDLFVLSVALWLAFAIRFDWQIPPPMLRMALISWVPLVAVQYAFLAALGVTRISWRYVSLRDALRILTSTVLASSAFLVVRFVAEA